jgi:hypothetical protein
MKTALLPNLCRQTGKSSENASPTIDLWSPDVMKQSGGLMRQKTNKNQSRDYDQMEDHR